MIGPLSSPNLVYRVRSTLLQALRATKSPLKLVQSEALHFPILLKFGILVCYGWAKQRTTDNCVALITTLLVFMSFQCVRSDVLDIIRFKREKNTECCVGMMDHVDATESYLPTVGDPESLEGQ